MKPKCLPDTQQSASRAAAKQTADHTQEAAPPAALALRTLTILDTDPTSRHSSGLTSRAPATLQVERLMALHGRVPRATGALVNSFLHLWRGERERDDTGKLVRLGGRMLRCGPARYTHTHRVQLECRFVRRSARESGAAEKLRNYSREGFYARCNALSRRGSANARGERRAGSLVTR